jgi:hypothetical protein
MGLVHHTDAEREWAYDRTSHIGQLDKALDESLTRGWLDGGEYATRLENHFPPSPRAMTGMSDSGCRCVESAAQRAQSRADITTP